MQPLLQPVAVTTVPLASQMSAVPPAPTSAAHRRLFGEQEHWFGVAAFPPHCRLFVQAVPQITCTPHDGFVTARPQVAPPVPGHIDASVSVQQVPFPQPFAHGDDVYMKFEPQVLSVVESLQIVSPGWHSPVHAGLVEPPVQVKAQVWTTIVHCPSVSQRRTAGLPLPSVPHCWAPGAQTPPQVFSFWRHAGAFAAHALHEP